MADKISIIEQTPAETNSIKTNKPIVDNVTNTLEGYIGNSWNGGFVKPVAWKKVTAGEKILKYNLAGIIRMLTPKVPVGQKLTTTFSAYFVPNSRVWENSEAFYSQKGASTKSKTKKYPNLQGKQLRYYITTLPDETTKYIPITNTQLWRDSYVSSYLPRLACNMNAVESDPVITLPAINALPLRGFKAIWNDMIRHKIYDTALTEYKADTVSDLEYTSFFPSSPSNTFWNGLILRGRRNDSYYTDYKTDLQGFENDYTAVSSKIDLQEHAEWQKLIAESRTQSENEQKNDWEIVAELRGTKPVKDGKVQFLGRKTVGINYTQVAQTSYNNGVEDENYQSLGVTGAYSYTEFNVELFNYREFIEDGFIHIVQQTSADSIFETGIDRSLLNINWDDEYRPDFKDLIDDVLLDIEKSSFSMKLTNPTFATGFKRKFSEYFKLPNNINGDLTSLPYYEINVDTDYDDYYATPLYTKKEFQFTELDDTRQLDNGYTTFLKDSWKDYTDIQINRNLAIEMPFIENVAHTPYLKGNNQLFMLAKATCVANLPLDNNIKTNFKVWGEQ